MEDVRLVFALRPRGAVVWRSCLRRQRRLSAVRARMVLRLEVWFGMVNNKSVQCHIISVSRNDSVIVYHFMSIKSMHDPDYRGGIWLDALE